MAASLNTKLTQLANEYYISHGSPEAVKIDSSVSTLIQKIKGFFTLDVPDIIEFGSYKRDTLLPRKYDNESDVDLMVVFNHASLGSRPGYYRDRLVQFADKYYSRSDVRKTIPTVTLELNHIKYDLVPTYIQTQVWNLNKTYYIPETDDKWMITDPHGFNTILTNANKSSNYNLKRIIRLLKAWNAKVGYPISSYALEQELTNITYWFKNTTEEYFFAAIEGLALYRNGNFYSPNAKVSSLKDNANRVKQYLQAYNYNSAYSWLSHILPM